LIAAMVFAICAGLRLARFNVMIDDPNRPAWAANFFVGMPAPGGAITVLRRSRDVPWRAPPAFAAPRSFSIRAIAF
jgi:phosphatidylserine synthase